MKKPRKFFQAFISEMTAVFSSSLVCTPPLVRWHLTANLD